MPAFASSAGARCGSWQEPHQSRSPLAILHALSESLSKWLVTFMSGFPDHTKTATESESRSPGRNGLLHSRARDPRLAGEVALCADAVAAVRRKLGRVDHLPAPRDMRLAGSMAALAGNSAFPERRHTVSVRRARQRLHPAGMALQADGLDAARQIKGVVLLVARRKVPLRGAAVPGDRRLIQESVQRVEITAPDSSRADEVFERPAAVHTRPSRS